MVDNFRIVSTVFPKREKNTRRTRGENDNRLTKSFLIFCFDYKIDNVWTLILFSIHQLYTGILP